MRCTPQRGHPATRTPRFERFPRQVMVPAGDSYRPAFVAYEKPSYALYGTRAGYRRTTIRASDFHHQWSFSKVQHAQSRRYRSRDWLPQPRWQAAGYRAKGVGADTIGETTRKAA